MYNLQLVTTFTSMAFTPCKLVHVLEKRGDIYQNRLKKKNIFIPKITITVTIEI